MWPTEVLVCVVEIADVCCTSTSPSNNICLQDDVAVVLSEDLRSVEDVQHDKGRQSVFIGFDQFVEVGWLVRRRPDNSNEFANNSGRLWRFGQPIQAGDLPEGRCFDEVSFEGAPCGHEAADLEVQHLPAALELPPIGSPVEEEGGAKTKHPADEYVEQGHGRDQITHPVAALWGQVSGLELVDA